FAPPDTGRSVREGISAPGRLTVACRTPYPKDLSVTTETTPPPPDLLARHKAVLPSWMPIYYDEPIEIVSGSGRRVTDAQGRSYLDFFGGVLTNMLGYDIPEVRDAVERQLRTGVVHTSTLYLIRQQVELAEKIAQISG